MIEYHFNEEEYLNDGVMFTTEVHENVTYFSMVLLGSIQDICKEGLVGPGEGLVSKKRVQMVVDFYSHISWEGKEGGGYPISTLSGFTIR